jgi:hypothetical protein
VPSLEERLRKELERLATPADASPGALERIASRRERRRVVRRLETSLLIAVVLTGTIAGTYGLMRVFGVGSRVVPGDGGSPTSLPTPVDPRAAIGPACGIYELEVDLDGDGSTDTLLTYAPNNPGVSCEDPSLALPYQMSVFLASGERFDQPLPDCRWPYACRPLATPDLDRNGRPDIAVQIMAGASTVQVELFATVGNPWSGTIAPLTVSPPGDPGGGFPPGTARFELYGSVTHQGALTCRGGGDGLPELVYTNATMEGPGTFLVHETSFVIDGSALSVTGTRDSRVSDTDRRFRRLEQGPDLCGAPVNGSSS